jgi:ketosteroid isomerase-like protein
MPGMSVAPHAVAAAIAIAAVACGGKGSGGGQPSGAQPADTAAEAKLIRDLDNEWQRRIHDQDTALAAIIYGDHAALLPPDAPAVEGRSAIASFYRGLFNRPNFSLTFESTHTEVGEGGKMAYERGTYRLTVGPSDRKLTEEGKYLVVWKKVDGRWRVVADMFSRNQGPR